VAVVLTLLLAGGIAAIRIATSHTESYAPEVSSAWTHGSASNRLAGLAAETAFAMAPARPQTKRDVYPYSVVPGGVESPEELQQAAAHDRVVAQHYAGFDFKRARVIELKQSQLMYLSYRMRDKIYWTSKRIRLRAGEKVISDGKTIARTRCANQVSESAKHVASPKEPPAEKFDQPLLADGGTAMRSPFPNVFDSGHRSDPALAGGGSGPGPFSSGYLFGPGFGTGYPPILSPPLPGGASACNTIFARPGKGDGTGENGLDETKSEKNCPKKPGPGKGPNPPPVVPEPGTIVLFTSGVAGIYLRYRKAKS
jgi:hypothetical protein